MWLPSTSLEQLIELALPVLLSTADWIGAANVDVFSIAITINTHNIIYFYLFIQ